jgi:hypothetical protein
MPEETEPYVVGHIYGIFEYLIEGATQLHSLYVSKESADFVAEHLPDNGQHFASEIEVRVLPVYA